MTRTNGNGAQSAVTATQTGDDEQYDLTLRPSRLEDFIGQDKLKENLTVILETLNRLKPSTAKGKYWKSLTISSSMGPGIKIDTNEAGSTAEA